MNLKWKIVLLIIGLILLWAGILFLCGCVERLPVDDNDGRNETMPINETHILRIPGNLSLAINSSDADLQVVFEGNNSTVVLGRGLSVFSVDFQRFHGNVFTAVGPGTPVLHFLGDMRNNTLRRVS